MSRDKIDLLSATFLDVVTGYLKRFTRFAEMSIKKYVDDMSRNTLDDIRNASLCFTNTNKLHDVLNNEVIVNE